MDSWFARNLGDASLAQESLDRLARKLETLYENAGKPDDMAAFFRHESEGRLHCEIIVYLSPGFAEAARATGARPCRKPSPHGLGLLAGFSGPGRHDR